MDDPKKKCPQQLLTHTDTTDDVENTNWTNKGGGSDWLIGEVSRMYTNGPRDESSTPGRVIPKTLKIVLDTTLLKAQQYKVRIKGKVE